MERKELLNILINKVENINVSQYAIFYNGVYNVLKKYDDRELLYYSLYSLDIELPNFLKPLEYYTIVEELYNILFNENSFIFEEFINQLNNISHDTLLILLAIMYINCTNDYKLENKFSFEENELKILDYLMDNKIMTFQQLSIVNEIYDSFGL
jgi:hypothetical protein